MLTKLNHNNHNHKRYLSIFLTILLTYIQILFPTLSSYFIISFTFSNNVYASPSIIVPDNSINIPNVNSNTHIDKTLNGTPMVNINNANSQGISANYYKDFNIDDKNLILNNYKGETTNTKLGGAIYGNPNFNVNNGREASIILNEITTNRVTNINGYLEVAGKKADVIIANPNGIMVSGAGFINVNRLSMITGSSIDKNTNSSFNNTELNPFNINNNINSFIEVKGINITDKDGNPIVYNLGVDANDLNYMDIISRIIKINGIIAGNNNTEVNLKTGNDKAKYNNQKGFIISSENKETNNKEQENNKPEFAIDSTAFGGIYAGRITIIATEDGVGVRNRTDLIATVDDINFDVNGNIIFEDESNLYSNKDINLNSKESIINTDSIISSNNDININTNNFINTGTDNIDINNDPYSATEKYVYNYDKAGTNETKMVGLETYTSKLTSNSSYLLANNNININTNNDLINHNSIIYSNNNIAITTNYLNNTITEFKVKEIQHWQWKEKRKHTTKKTTYRYHNWDEYKDLLLTTSTPSKIIAKDQLVITTNEINNGVNNNNLNNNNVNLDNINNNNNNNNTSLLNNINHINNDLTYNLNNNLYETDNNLTNTNYLLKSKYYKDRMGGLDLYNMDSIYLRNNYLNYELIKRELEQNSLYQNSTASLVGNNIIITSNNKNNNNNNNTSLNNNGLIQANNNLIIEDINIINNNNKSTLRSGNNILIDTGIDGVVNNLSGTIEIDDSINNINTNNTNINNNINNNNNNNTIYINTGTLNNITLSQQNIISFEEHNNKNDYQYTKTTTDIGDTATIKSNNSNSNIIINTDKDINMVGADIVADNSNTNIELTTNNGNINITTLQNYDYERQYTNIDGNTFGTTNTKEYINETIDNSIQSNIIAGNNININSNNNLNSIGTNFESKTGDINLNIIKDLNLYNTLNSIYNYNYTREEKFDLSSAITNIAVATAVGLATGGAGVAVMAGLSATSNSTNMTKGSITTSIDYDEEIVANNIIGNNININIGNDATMISTILNAKDKLNLSIGNTLTIDTAEEQHIHKYNRETFGGNITNAIVGGTITGLTTSLGVKGGEYLGGYLNGVVGSSSNILNGAINGASSLTSISVSNKFGTSASIMVLNGETNAWDILKKSAKETTSKEAFKDYLISASIGATGGAIGGWIKETKVKYNSTISPEDEILHMEKVPVEESNLKPGSPFKSKIGVNSYKVGDKIIKAGTTSEVVGYGESNQNLIFKILNMLPGSPSFADFHDASNFEGTLNKLTIFSHYPISQFNAVYKYYPIYKQHQDIKDNGK